MGLFDSREGMSNEELTSVKFVLSPRVTLFKDGGGSLEEIMLKIQILHRIMNLGLPVLCIRPHIYLY